MNPYVSPALYRTMGFGVDLSDVEDSDLARQLLVASSLVDRYCNQPRGHDFRGGTITDEQHRWEVSNGYAPGTQRIWPDHRPVLSCSSFRIQVTNTQYLDISDHYLFINKTSGYIEPVIAASSIGVWSYSAIPVAGLVIPVAKVTYTYGYDYTISGEVLTPDGGQVYRSANQWWTDDEVAVYKNGIALEEADYTVDRSEGTVELGVGVEVDYNDIISADYHHKLPWEVRDAVGMVATQLLGNRAIVAAGMQGISGIKVEEVEIRQSRDAQAAKTEVSGLAASLLEPFKWRGFA